MLISMLVTLWQKLFRPTPADHEFRKWQLFVVAFFVFLCFFLPVATFDSGSYVVWSQYIQEHGLAHIYELVYVNYMPLNIFALQIWQVVCSWLGWDLANHFQYIKIYPLLFDCATVLLMLSFARKYKASLLTVALLFLPNVAFLYNSLIWGQFDSIYTFFVLLSIWLILEKKATLALLAFFLAMNAKIQAIIFLPALLIFLWLYVFQKGKDWLGFLLAALRAVAICLLVQGLFFLPFSATPPQEIIQLVIQRSAALSTYVTFNADNWWALLGVPSVSTLDTELWLAGITYRHWGVLLLGVMTLLSFLPFAGIFLQQNCGRFLAAVKVRLPAINSFTDREWTEMIALLFYLQSLSFFYFFTQMHERYSHPALAFAGLFAVLARKKALFFLTCLAYLGNLERINLFWKDAIDLSGISWISQASAALFLMGLALALGYLYALYWGGTMARKAT